MNLGQYQDKVYFYLRDQYRVYYPLAEVNDAINQARADLVVDTHCQRAISSGVFTVPNQVKYTYQSVLTDIQTQIPSAAAIVAINGIAIYWSATLKPTLDYLPWEDFNAWYLSFTGFTFIPSVWSEYAIEQSFYLAPFPSSAYQLETDCIYLPNSLFQISVQELS